jgi:hypothetical protein
MKLRAVGLLWVASLALVSSLANGAAYIRGASAPWGEVTNEAAMDQVFGVGGWEDLRMADGASPFTSGEHDFIFLEGGDGTAIELADYLAANRTEIENFVTNGGALLLNSAPNEGGDIDFGFGGVTLVSGEFSSNVVAADATHPVFIGPFTPVQTSYSGSSFGHAIVGGGVSAIIIGAPGDSQEGLTVLGEASFGAGFVLFGGMTTDNFHSPQPEAANLRANIISYTAGGGNFTPTAPLPVPASPLWSLVLLVGLMSFWATRRKFLTRLQG